MCTEARYLRVALLAEGVDRNEKDVVRNYTDIQSPSSRRAWIEITPSLRLRTKEEVALLAEGVDRNNGKWHFTRGMAPSPSSRRAWIEIPASVICRP